MMLKVALEDIWTKKMVMVEALLDSGCTQTCINGEFLRKSGLSLEKIRKPITVEYMDGTTMDEARI
jgi:predicted aspartyl protease